MTHQHRRFAGDRYALSGFWGAPTSAANFCEEDYAVTRYIAEFINALSSLSYAYLATRPPSKKTYTWHPHSLALTLSPSPLSASLFLVGLSSTLYHATLRQGPQYSDDLAMLLLGACLLQHLYTYGQTPAASKSITGAITVAMLSAAWMYIRSGKIIHHLLTFTGMVNLIWPRTVYLVLCVGREEGEWRELMGRFWKAVGLLTVGFLVWNLDLEMCAELRAVRERMGLPWAWGLELHGWWHLLTALGAAEYIALVRAL